MGSSSGPLVSSATRVQVGATAVDQSFAWQGQFANREEGTYGLYVVALAAGSTYRISTSGSHNGGDDPYLYVGDTFGNVLARDDNSGGGLEASIAFRAPATGDFIIALRAAARATAGRCNLAVVDVSAPTLAGTPLGIGQTLDNQPFAWQQGFVNRQDGTYGQYVVQVVAGQTYEFETGVPGTGSTDTYLYLLDGAGAIIAENDNITATSSYSKITYAATANLSLLVRLRAFSQADVGTCALTARTTGATGGSGGGVSPAPPGTQLLVGTPLASQTFEWRNGFADREDGTYGEYVVNLTGGTTYEIETSNPATGPGLTDDSYLYLYDLNGGQQASDDDGGANYMSKITYSPLATAYFKVKLRAFTQGDTGRCTLELRQLAPSGAGTPLPPDMQTLASASAGYLHDVYYQGSASSGEIHFSNANFNGGRGDLTLRMQNNNGTMVAYQRIWDSGGGFTERLAGQFVFATHSTHNHYHFDHFNDYNLRSVTAGNGVGGVVATSNKVSFCLIDVDHWDPSIRGPVSNSYDCNNQGISAGWADVYSSGLQGQEIDVSALPAGAADYWLESVVDPADLIVETDDTNNVTRIKVRIDKTAGTARVVP